MNFISAVVMMSGLGLMSVVTVQWLRPTQDNMSLITAILGFLVTILTLLRVQETNTKIVETSSKLDDTNVKVDKTHDLVNGGLAKLLEQKDITMRAAVIAERALGIMEGRAQQQALHEEQVESLARAAKLLKDDEAIATATVLQTARETSGKK